MCNIQWVGEGRGEGISDMSDQIDSFQPCQENLFDSFMNLIVDFTIFLFSIRDSEEWPYRYKSTFDIKHCIFLGNNISNTAMRSDNLAALWMSQVNRKCAVSSHDLLQSHKSSGVSRKLCFFLWNFNGLKPSLNWKMNLITIESEIPKVGLGFGRIRFVRLFLKTAMERVEQKSTPTEFHDRIEAGKNCLCIWWYCTRFHDT